MPSLRLVFSSPRSVSLGILAFAGIGWLELWSSQVVSFDPGPTFLIEPEFIVAALVIAALCGVLVPMQVFAMRLAARVRAGTSLVGIVIGTASMTCCAPVLLPSILSLLGFSGTTLLGFNGLLRQYWLPLATVSVILLAYSVISVAQSLAPRCQAPGEFPTERE